MYEDDICRVAFAEAVMVRHLLALLPNDVAARLDPRRLRRLSTEHVGTDGQRRRADMSWAVGIRGQQAEALLALEFQSAPNRRMTLRMAVYTALLLQEVAAEGRSDALLPWVLPVVVYTGRSRWRPATLTELTAPAPTGWSAQQLRFELHLLDAATLKAELGLVNPAAALLRLLANRSAEALPALTATLFGQLRREARVGFRDRLARAMMRMLIARFGGDRTDDRRGEQLQRALRTMEEPSMLAEAVEEWAAEAHAKGVQQGLSEGGIEVLRRIAAWRFGVAAGDRFGMLLAGEDASERLTQVTELVLDSRSVEELLVRVRRLLQDGNGVR